MADILSDDEFFSAGSSSTLDDESFFRLGDSKASQVGQNVAEFGKGIPGGAVGLVGTAITGAGANAVGFTKDQLAVMDRIDRGEAVPMEQDATGYGAMSPDERAAFREQYQPVAERPLRENPLVKAGQAVSTAGRELLPASPGYEESTGRQLGEGMGSMLGGAAISMVPGVGQAAGVGMFALSGSGEAVERAMKNGATDDQIIEAARLGLIPGMTDSMPVEVLLGRVPLPGMGKLVKIPAGMQGKALEVSGKIGLQATVEGIQEGGQSFLQNAIAQDVYKPDQSLTEGVLPDAGMGAGVGAIAETGKLALSAFAGRRGGHVPAGEREKVAAEPAPVSAEDQSSPIPTDLIAAGRKALADVDATHRANEILSRWEMPKVGSQVAVEQGEVRATGVVVDAFTDEDGLPGAKILMADGTLFERYFTAMRDSGVRIVPIAADTAGAPLALPKPDVTYGDGFVMGDPAREEPMAVPEQPAALPPPSTVYGDGFRMGGDLGRVSDAMTEVKAPASAPADVVDAEFSEAPPAPLALPPPETVYGEGFTTRRPEETPAQSDRPLVKQDGAPFSTESSARLAAKTRADLKGKGFDVIKIPGGFGLAPPQAPGQSFRGAGLPEQQDADVTAPVIDEPTQAEASVPVEAAAPTPAAEAAAPQAQPEKSAPPAEAPQVENTRLIDDTPSPVTYEKQRARDLAATTETRQEWQMPFSDFSIRRWGPSWAVIRSPNQKTKPGQTRVKPSAYTQAEIDHKRAILRALQSGESVPEDAISAHLHEEAFADEVDRLRRMPPSELAKEAEDDAKYEAESAAVAKAEAENPDPPRRLTRMAALKKLSAKGIKGKEAGVVLDRLPMQRRGGRKTGTKTYALADVAAAVQSQPQKAQEVVTANEAAQAAEPKKRYQPKSKREANAEAVAQSQDDETSANELEPAGESRFQRGEGSDAEFGEDKWQHLSEDADAVDLEETRVERKKLELLVNGFIRRIAGGAAPHVEVYDAVRSSAEGESVNGIYIFEEGGAKRIAISLQSGDVLATARHETIHFLRETGAIDASTWRVLERQAAGWRQSYEIDDRYAADAERFGDRGEDLLNEEAVAEAYKAFGNGELDATGRVRRVFQMIGRFLEAMRNWIAGDGFRTAKGVFSNIEAGGLARNEPVVTSTSGSRFDQPVDFSEDAESFSRQIADETGDEISADSILAAGGALFQRVKETHGTKEQEAALDRILAPNDADKPVGVRIRERIAEFKADAARSLRQGMLDQFDALAVNEREVNGKLLDATNSAYKAARLTQNLRSVMHVLLKRGMIDYREGEFVPVGGFDGGFEAIFAPLAEKGLLRLWQGWAIANRAQRLMREGRENLLNQAEITALLALEKEHPEFRAVQKKWATFNKAILDMAEHSGVLNPESRELWEKDDYVPFFRLLEEGVKGPKGKGGLANQRSGIKALKGGEAAINDLIENMVQNVTHLVDASYKNVAAKRAIRDAKTLGVVEAVGMDWQAVRLSPEQLASALEGIGVEVQGLTKAQHEQWQTFFTMRPPSAPDVVSVMVGGKPKFFKVHDPFLLRALSAMRWNGFDNPIINLMGGAKRLLTQGITAFPDFMIANAIRDSLSSWVVTGGKTNPLTAAKGFVSSLSDTTSRSAISAAGAGSSGFYDTTPADVRKELKGMLGADRAGWARRLWEGWSSIGQATENANRIALYKALREDGVSQAEAAFQAMDLMDFAMRGDSAAMRFLITVVPFLNARVQGLYKLGRAADENRSGFALRGAVIATASLVLMASNWDRDEYEALNDWEKDTYFHLWLGGQHFRIPKPFEVGALFGTLPERMARWVGGKDTTGRFMGRLGQMFSDTFAMNPTPQMVKPMIEQWANKSTFTGEHIVSMGLERLHPGDQANAGTSAGAVLLGKMAPKTISPVRVDALMRGYFGTLGTTIMAVTDGIEAVVSGKERPDRRIEDMPIVGRYLRNDAPARSTRYLQDFYELRDEVSRVASSARRKQDDGDVEGARTLLAENRDKIALNQMLNRAADQLSDISRRMRQVAADKSMTGAEKRRLLDDLTAQRNAFAKRAVEAAGKR